MTDPTNTNPNDPFTMPPAKPDIVTILQRNIEEARLDLEKVYQRLGLPWPLSKALSDPFEYAVGLRDGSVVHFESASIRLEAPEFITLNGVRHHSVPAVDVTHDRKPWPFSFERGLVIRISDVMWAADAPHGS